jgi:hypothetical protein
MTPLTPWHPPESVLQGYVDGHPTALSGASVEAHLVACSQCRTAVRDAVPTDRLIRVRAGLEDRVDALGRPAFERLLVWLGLQEVDVRVLLATPALRAAWWMAVVAATGLGVLNLRNGRDPEALFLLLAPLVPVCTTALAYAPGLDSAFWHVAATPYSTTRMLLARSLAVGATALLGTACAALVLPDRDMTSVAWLMPAVAMTLTALALCPRFGAVTASSVVGAAWVSFVVLLRREGVDVRGVFGVTGQLVVGAVALVALAVLVDQQKRLDGGGTS